MDDKEMLHWAAKGADIDLLEGVTWNPLDDDDDAIPLLLQLLCLLSPLRKINKSPIQDAGVKLVEHAEEGDTTVIGRVTQVTSFRQANDCTRHMVYLLNVPHQ